MQVANGAWLADWEFYPEEKQPLKRIPGLDKNGLEAWGTNYNLTDGLRYDLRMWYNEVVVPGTTHDYVHDGSPEVVLWQENAGI